MTGKPPAPSKTLPRQVKVLGLVSFFNDVASEMILPLMPAFITMVLGLGPHVLGLMEGVAKSVAAVLKYLSGWWSDRLKRRKPLLAAGYTLSSVLRPLMGAVTAGWQVVGLRGIDRVGKGVRTAPRDALLADAAPAGQRGRVFGFHRAMDNAGAVVGPMTALFMLLVFHLDLRTIFLLTAIPGLVTIGLVFFAVREKTPGQQAPEKEEGRLSEEGDDARRNQRAFYVFLASMLLFTLGNSTDVFLVLRAQELGVPVALAPVLWMVLHLSKTLLSTPGGALSDRIGRRPTILMGWGVYALAYFGFAFADDSWQMWPLLVFYGLYYGLTEGPEKALTSDLVPGDRRGRGFGLYHLGVGIAAFPASVLAGFLWKAYGATAALGFGAVCAALAAVVLAFGFKPSTLMDKP